VKRFYLPLCSLILLSACAEKEEYIEKPVDTLYNDAMDTFESKSYKKAARAFAEVERQHPYSNWAVKSELMAAFCHYQAKEYDEAIEGFKVFIQLHPGHADIPYAYYMMGICNYEQVPIVERDQKPTEEALSSFQEVVSRFPNSPYARDAKFKLDMIRDHLATKEMDVGRYYLRQKSYLAAVKRFKIVVDNFQTTTQAPEALLRLVECYVALGIMDQAKACAAVLGHNYPGSTWYQAAFDLMAQQGIKVS
jgi:outer membrane protein assembly factor BamD